jgi:hypothetical protein
MLDHRPGLIDDAPAGCPKRETEVDVLAVHRREAGIEAADIDERGAADQEASG